MNYPGLSSHPQHALAQKVMRNGFGGMLSFEVKGGVEAGVYPSFPRLISHLSIDFSPIVGRVVVETLKVITLAVSLGGVESLIEHPATMTHQSTPHFSHLDSFF